MLSVSLSILSLSSLLNKRKKNCNTETLFWMCKGKSIDCKKCIFLFSKLHSSMRYRIRSLRHKHTSKCRNHKTNEPFRWLPDPLNVEWTITACSALCPSPWEHPAHTGTTTAQVYGFPRHSWNTQLRRVFDLGVTVNLNVKGDLV